MRRQPNLLSVLSSQNINLRCTHWWLLYKANIILSIRCIPTAPHHISIIRDFDSSIPPPDNPRRWKIDGQLKDIGNTVFIPSLKYNVTIMDLYGKSIVVLPHDYRYPDKYLPSQLRHCGRITCHQRIRFEELRIYYFDHLLLDGSTYPAWYHR